MQDKQTIEQPVAGNSSSRQSAFAVDLANGLDQLFKGESVTVEQFAMVLSNLNTILAHGIVHNMSTEGGGAAYIGAIMHFTSVLPESERDELVQTLQSMFC